jgi:hypothetical protein
MGLWAYGLIGLWAYGLMGLLNSINLSTKEMQFEFRTPFFEVKDL